ncbi:DUF3267 domain-containing protein [Bacillus piscicola]|uniref:DUF3267 domain-containing protein n=1 Tax=Bacillus piscicola TaxID=1632684 RepID=UPI001F098AD7|nr:DUF3267 domain-containing protein [Bacillus piscicola]
MNCWKSINVKKDYHTSKLTLYSISSMIGVFVVSYLFFSFYHNDVHYAEVGLLQTCLFFTLLFPFHTLLSIVPLWCAGVRVKLHAHHSKIKILPRITKESKKPINRNTYLLAILFPTVFAGLVSLLGAFLFPSYMHFFLLVLAFNTGLGVYDFIYVKQLLGAPRDSLIEQKQNSLDILLKQPM